MRHRILRSTIAVVAVTGLFLGLPLMFYTWRWLDDTARTDLQHRLQRASSAILLQEQRTGVTDEPPVEALRLLVPSDGRLVLTYTDRTGASRELAVGRGPLEHAMVEGTSLGDAGMLRIEQDYAGVRDDQFRALSIELIVMVLSLTAGVVVAAVTASRVALANKEFELLRFLMEHAGRLLSREEILADVWGDSDLRGSKTLDMHISWLRRKIGDDTGPQRRIVTVRGVGFRFDAE